MRASELLSSKNRLGPPEETFRGAWIRGKGCVALSCWQLHLLNIAGSAVAAKRAGRTGGLHPADSSEDPEAVSSAALTLGLASLVTAGLQLLVPYLLVSNLVSGQGGPRLLHGTNHTKSRAPRLDTLFRGLSSRSQQPNG